MSSSEGVALVLGSGMAGLATAQVLSKFFQRVIVLEKDFPEANNDMSAVEVANELEHDPRPGVAQYKQLHALLAKGLCAYDDIFQGRFTKALIAAGANVVPQYESYLVCHPISGYVPWLRNTAPKEQAYSVSCTRHLLETTTRKLLADNPRVEFMYGASVAGLVFEGEGVGGHVAASADRAGGNRQQKAVAGVRLSDGSCLPGQLVVDCSGRGSNLPSWLAAAGFKRPRTSRAGCNTGYCTWFCKLDPDVDAVLRENNVYVHAALPAAPVQTFALFMRTEGNVWLAGVGGNEGVHPGHKQGDLMAFAEQAVWHPGAARILAGSTQLSPACFNQGVGSTWRHYEEINLPDGLLVLGDAICSFNPQYGQGMTVAAIEATALKQLLTDRYDQSNSSSSGSSGSSEWLHGLHQQLQKAVLPTIRLAWQLAVGGDMRYPSATSNDSASTNAVQHLMMGYVDLLFKFAATDAAVNEGLLRVTNMLDEPSALFHPRMLSRVITFQLMGCLPAPVVAAMHKVLQQGRALLPWLVGSAWAGAAQGSHRACVGAHKAVKGSVQWPEAVLRLLGVEPIPPASC